MSVAAGQTDLFLRSPQRAVALDVQECRAGAAPGAVIFKHYFVPIVLVAYIGQRAWMVARTVHVAVEILLQVPVVAQVPDHEATGAAGEIKEVAEATSPARGEHGEQL